MYIVNYEVHRIKEVRWAWHVASTEEIINYILFGNPIGKRELGRHKHRWWDNNVKIYLEGASYENVDCINLV
jgi:hypothetical protein